MAKSTKTGKKQSFAFKAPGALRVQLVGDFTHWQEAPITMKKDKDGIWRASVDLEPGSYHYRFVVDGEWCDDPECTLRVPNPFGTQNAVRHVA
jgi:5'-AMP-activated protein kinase regulatory beta subunit